MSEGSTLIGYLARRAKNWLDGKPSSRTTVREEEASQKPDPLAGLYNPLKLRLDGHVGLDLPPFLGQKLDDRTFTVDGAAEFTRRIGAQTLVFTDYVLIDELSDDGLEVTVRVMPENGTRQGDVKCFLFGKIHDQGYDDKLVKRLNKKTLKETIDGQKMTFEGTGEPFDAQVREVFRESARTVGVRYWDFVHQKDGEVTILTVEIDTSGEREGWTYGFVGQPVSRQDIRLIAGHSS